MTAPHGDRQRRLPARHVGQLQTGISFSANDHACWAYSTDDELADMVVAWLADGLRIGQRALYVCDGPAAGGLANLAPLDPAPLIARGALQIAEAAQLYDLSTPIDAASQLRRYAAAVDRACADGFDGVRVAADITTLVANPARRAAHVQWEQLADRYASGHPLAPLCLYDSRRVSDIDAIESVHPLQGPRSATFALYGAGERRAMLAGEIDALTDERFARALGNLPDTDGELDLSGLTFLDGQAAWRLHEEVLARRARGQQFTLVAAPPILRRIWSLCGFDSTLLAA